MLPTMARSLLGPMPASTTVPTASRLVAGRSQASRGFFGHISMGMAWSTVACAFVYAGIPAIRAKWPEAKKALEDQGVDLSFLSVDQKSASSPPAQKTK
mmetsp:Transcript_3862/g.9276  ORF Transcript_3862/g.9276 Transcript_3862/m.9276 type:complete len:99 (+) Transcript_3862:329-625(+)